MSMTARGRGIDPSKEETAMATSLLKKSGLTLGVCGLAAALFALAACAMSESTSDDDTSGVVVAVKDSTQIVIQFDSDTSTLFTDSGSFNLDEIRKKMRDKDIDPDSIEITGLAVTYDETTAQFIRDNEGVRFYLEIFIRENETGAAKLALETLVTDKNGLKALAFDPKLSLLLLNQHIFAAPGFADVLTAIKDTGKHSMKAIAKLHLNGDKLKKAGTLKLNMVVTVAGKV
jgi:hypothetical protein